jgi:hypothetical protein
VTPKWTDAAPRWMDVLPRRCEALSRRAGASPICHDAVPRREDVVVESLPASREASRAGSSDGRIRCGRVAFLPSGQRAARLVGGSRAGPGAAGAKRGCEVLRKPTERDDVPGASQTRRYSPFDPGRIFAGACQPMCGDTIAVRAWYMATALHAAERGWNAAFEWRRHHSSLAVTGMSGATVTRWMAE